MQLPKRKSELLRQSKQQTDNYMTAEAVERIKKTIARLEKERPAAAEEVARTAAMGDLSENAGYQDAKRELRRINNKIVSLKEKLKNAIVIEINDSGIIQIGSTVTLESNGKKMTYQIVGSLETDPLKGRISHSSPLGSALIGHIQGDIVEVKNFGYKIISID